MAPPSKRLKTGDESVLTLPIEPRHPRGPGTLYTFGNGEFSQLGIDKRAEKRKFPALVERLSGQKCIEVCAGGLHTVVLTADGSVWTFGCNDEKALGRSTEAADVNMGSDESESEDEDSPEDKLSRAPTKVVFTGSKTLKFIQVSAGDSHSAALTTEGHVFIWGTFRDANGPLGLLSSEKEKCIQKPLDLTAKFLPNVRIVKIASGIHHLAMLSDQGKVYTMGSNDMGQLGRLQSSHNTRRSLDPRVASLTPSEIVIRKKMVDIWPGKNATFLKSRTGEILVCGLNSHGQLGIAPNEKVPIVPFPIPSKGFKGKDWAEFSGGDHHTVALDSSGHVYTLGRGDDGRLGLGENEQETHLPTLVPELALQTFINVAAGVSVSYAVSKDGKVYSWGFGANWQLGKLDDEDANVPIQVKANAQQGEIGGVVVWASGGGQHSAIIVQEKKKTS